MHWWGPKGVKCHAAEVELRVGGRYRIGNLMPDASLIWICGEFLEVEADRRLVYSWQLEGVKNHAQIEVVSVDFLACEQGTTVVVHHKMIAGADLRDQHERGWLGCLNGLAQLFCG